LSMKGNQKRKCKVFEGRAGSVLQSAMKWIVVRCGPGSVEV
jgi:hypothetical protein